MKPKELLEWAPVVVALPFFHLLASSIFLWSYVTAFGDGLSVFVSPADIFRVSISDLIGSYIFSTAVFGYLVITRYNNVTMPKVIGFERNRTAIKLAPVFIFAFAGIAFGVYLEYIFGPPSIGRYSSTAILIMLNMIVVLGWIYVRAWKNIRRIRYDLGIALVFTFIGIVSTGTSRGEEDRRSSHQFVMGYHAACRNVIIIRAFSEYYLAIRSDNKKILIDASCNERFLFPDVATDPD